MVDGIVAALALQWLPPLALWLLFIFAPSVWMAAICMALLLVFAARIKKIALI